MYYIKRYLIRFREGRFEDKLFVFLNVRCKQKTYALQKPLQPRICNVFQNSYFIQQMVSTWKEVWKNASDIIGKQIHATGYLSSDHLMINPIMIKRNKTLFAQEVVLVFSMFCLQTTYKHILCRKYLYLKLNLRLVSICN